MLQNHSRTTCFKLVKFPMLACHIVSTHHLLIECSNVLEWNDIFSFLLEQTFCRMSALHKCHTNINFILFIVTKERFYSSPVVLT